MIGSTNLLEHIQFGKPETIERRVVYVLLGIHCVSGLKVRLELCTGRKAPKVIHNDELSCKKSVSVVCVFV